MQDCKIVTRIYLDFVATFVGRFRLNFITVLKHESIIQPLAGVVSAKKFRQWKKQKRYSIKELNDDQQIL